MRNHALGLLNHRRRHPLCLRLPGERILMMQIRAECNPANPLVTPAHFFHSLKDLVNVFWEGIPEEGECKMRVEVSLNQSGEAGWRESHVTIACTAKPCTCLLYRVYI